MGDHVAASTTQQRYPVRAVARTVLANVVSFLIVAGIVAPIVLAILEEELAEFLPENVLAVLSTTALLLAAVSAALTRILAIPRVDQSKLLQRLHLSSAPNPAPPAPVDDVTFRRGAVRVDP